MRNFAKIAVTIGAVTLATSSFAQPKPEAFVKHRQSAMALMGWYFGSLGPVAKGEKPFNKEDAVRATGFLVPLSKMPWEGFVPGTETVGNTRALPEVWKSNADFKELATAMQTEMGKLAAFANAGDEAGFKKQFGAVGKSCKNCHDEFQKKP